LKIRSQGSEKIIKGNILSIPRSLNGESGYALHLVYKFDKQIARCNNSQIKILDLFEFPHILAA